MGSAYQLRLHSESSCMGIPSYVLLYYKNKKMEALHIFLVVLTSFSRTASIFHHPIPSAEDIEHLFDFLPFLWYHTGRTTPRREVPPQWTGSFCTAI